MWTIPTAIVVALLTAVLGYLAGLHRDGRTEHLLRERDRLREVQVAAIDVIEGCRDMLGARLSTFHLDTLYDRLEAQAQMKDVHTAAGEIQSLRESRSANRQLDASQSADASRQINHAATKLRIVAPSLVSKAKALRDYVGRMSDDDMGSADVQNIFDEQADLFARAVQAHLTKGPLSRDHGWLARLWPQ